MDYELSKMDEELAGIDGEIVTLLKNRMTVSERMAEYQSAHGMQLSENELERQALSRAAELAGTGMEDGAEAVFRAITLAEHTCRTAAARENCAAWDALSAALGRTPELFPQRATVACQGVEGAYSQIACAHLFKSPSIMYFGSFEHIFRAVESGMCRYGVLPIENSTAGSVNAVYDLMISHNFSIVRSARLQISHCLLANRNARLEDIREIFSHEQALAQCAGFLSTLPNTKVTVVENTAVAAKLVAESGRTDAAALSSRDCGELYGLSILRSGVQDQGGNYTRFICISKEPEIYPGADRMSLMMVLPHKPGTLYNAISKFYALGLNMRKIESRPLPDREFEFMFYFDIETSMYAPQTKTLFRALDGVCEQLRCLGAYSEIVC